MDPIKAVLPTISNTWVEPGAVTVGWWAGTRRPDGDGGDRALAWDVFSRLAEVLPGGSNMNARSQWYQRSFARDDQAATVYYDGVGRARGGVMLSLRQRWFEQVADPVPAIAGLLAGWHVSRLDLAADDDNPARMTPADLYARLPAARSRSRPEHRRLMQDYAGGATLSIGSRVSPRYGRIYVKGERIRHEVELKQDAAGSAWALVAAGAELVDVWLAEYGRLVRWR